MAGHVHGPTSGTRLWVSLGVTLVFVAVEAVAGWKANSLALLSDAGHNFTDALALGLAAFALWIAQRPANARRTFGYHRVAILTALFNAVTLLGIAAVIGVEAWQRFRQPEVASSGPMIVVALIAVAMNTVIALALAGDAKHSLNSRAAYIHMMGDALSAAAVVVAGIVLHFTGWKYADPLVSVLIAAFIAYSAWGIVVEATDILLENTPKGLDVEALIARIQAVPLVQGVHDLHIWTVGDGLNFLSCHVVLPRECSLTDCTTVVETINQVLHDDFAIGHATIQTEVEGMCQLAHEIRLYCQLEPHHHDHSHDHSHSHSH